MGTRPRTLKGFAVKEANKTGKPERPALPGPLVLHKWMDARGIEPSACTECPFLGACMRDYLLPDIEAFAAEVAASGGNLPQGAAA